MAFFAEVALASLVAGTLGSLLGIGGGLILVPFLTLALGVNMHYAIGASIISVIATSSGAATAFLRDRLVNLRLALVLNTATVAGAVLGALLAGYVNARVLAGLFGFTLLGSAAALFRTRNSALPPEPPAEAGAPRAMTGAYFDAELEREVRYEARHLAPSLACLFLAGVISGMLGIGGGAFLVLVMDGLMRLPIKVATSTSNFMLGVTASASSGAYFARGDIHPAVAAPVALGILVGAVAGARLLRVIPAGLLRRLFIVVLAVTAVQMLWRTFQGRIL
jgi:uncharacterized membrane protein YfcA